MQLAQLRTIFTRTAVFYPIVAAAIIVPNLMLGIYGYWALRSQQMVSEGQIEAAYRTIIHNVRTSIRAELTKLERRVPSRFPNDQTPSDAAVTVAAFADSEGFVKDCFLLAGNLGRWILPPVDAPGDETTSASAAAAVPPDAAIEATPSTSSDAISGTVEAGMSGGLAPLPGLEHAAARRAYFARHALDYLRLHLGPFQPPSHVPVWQADREAWPYPEVFFLRPVQVGAEPAVVVAWLDLDFVNQQLVQPLFRQLKFDPGMMIELHAGRAPNPETFLVLETFDDKIAPHWLIGIRVENIDEFKQSAKAGATIYMMLIAIFLPFVGVGTWLMVRSLIRDIREARLKTDFVSRVTHELKTPLTSIRLFIETLQMGGATSEEEVQKCLDIIMQESERLSKLIERILDLSKMESANKVYHFREDDFEQVVRDTIDFFRKQAQRSGGVIRLYIERNLPRFFFDRDGVREILLNLLENAIKYSVGEKLVAIRVTRTKFRDMDAVQAQVIDNGVGIRKEDVPRIFEKFYRVDDTLTKGIDGSGLGLTVSREIARGHGGEILVESQHGRGSKFTVCIPIRYSAPPPA